MARVAVAIVVVAIVGSEYLWYNDLGIKYWNSEPMSPESVHEYALYRMALLDRGGVY